MRSLGPGGWSGWGGIGRFYVDMVDGSGERELMIRDVNERMKKTLEWPLHALDG